ncbi:hypothetical protein ACFL38_02175 [Candidatus Omnitrophota bacterium]
MYRIKTDRLKAQQAKPINTLLLILLIFVFFANTPVFAETFFGLDVRVDDSGASSSLQYDSSIAVDASGNIYVAWGDKRNGNSDIYFSKSTDGGFTFEPNIRVDDTGSETSSQGGPSIAVDNSNIYVVWGDGRNGNSDIYFSKSIDGGFTFEPNVRVDDTGSATSNQGSASIVVDASGTIYVVWNDKRNENYDIYFSKSIDNGLTFEPNVRVDDTGSDTSHQMYPSLAADASGNIFVAWQDMRNGNWDIYFAKSTNGGISFLSDVRVDDTGSAVGYQLDPSLAADASGNIFVAWEDNRNGNYDIFFSKSINGGVSFLSDVRVDDTGSAVSHQTNPSLAADVDDNVYVTWYDQRNGGFNIYFAKSLDADDTFGANIRVNDIFSSGTNQPSLGIDTDGNVYISWDDGRNWDIGNWDIYFCKGIKAVPSDPPVADSGGEYVAGVNETVMLDGSGSYDPDGEILYYIWTRQPEEELLCFSTEPTCETTALGRAEEIIELEVIDNGAVAGSDTAVIVNHKADVFYQEE